jgi:hypothetical protein
VNRGYEVEPDLLADRITTLTTLADLTGDLVATASRLAERPPLLGTAPPAVALSNRLSAAAGQSGLAGEISAAEREVAAFRQTLAEIQAGYSDQEADATATVRAVGESA